ncbi:MAG: VanZ family protein [Capnocytophaga sp.]|nr:VanZ family protein [Capnocytophaga sp.]
MKKIKKYAIFILFLYLLFLTYMLLRPANSLPKDFILFEGADKIVHCCVFVMLSFLFKIAFPKVNFWVLLLILFIYGILTEVAQEFAQTGRSGDVFDLVADTIGIVIGWFSYDVFRKFFRNILP